MRRDRVVKWSAILMLVLVLGAAAGGIVYATTSASQTDREQSQESTGETASTVAADDEEPGLVVVKVARDGPAATAGVVRGDILLELNGAPVDTVRELERQLDALNAGDKAELKVLHGDDERTLTATLDERNGRPNLGLVPYDDFHALRFEATFPKTPGAIIARVLPDTPADEAGLKEGDAIVKVDAQALDQDNGLADLIGAHKPGDTITLEIERPGQDPFDVTVELSEHPEQQDVAYLGVEYLPSPRFDFRGDFRPFDQLPFGLQPFFDEGMIPLEQGAVIQRVTEDSPASSAGLSEGDVITAIAGEPVEGPQDLVNAIAERKPGDTVTLTVFDSEAAAEREVEVTLAEHPEDEGRAYLGVAIGGFLRFRQFEGELPHLDRLPFDVPVPPLGEAPFGVPAESIQGAIIQRVAEDSPAAAAGLSGGSVITAIAGEPVVSTQALVDAIAEREPGDTVALTVLDPETDEEREVEVTLVEHPDNEGQAYLGVSTGGFLRWHRSDGPQELPGMQPFRRFFERFREGSAFDGGDGYRFRLDASPHLDGDRVPFGFDLDFESPQHLEEAPCCTDDVTA